MVSEMWEAFTRDKPMTLASITTAAVSLLLLGGFLAGWFQVEKELASVPDKFEMRVFLRDDTTKDEVAAITDRLNAMPLLTAVRFVPREEAWKEFRQTKGSKTSGTPDAELTADMPNPLPDSFVVKLRRLEDGDAAAAQIRAMPEVDHDGVRYLREEQKQVAAFMRFVRLLGLGVTGALMFSTAVLIFNTLRLTVIARRREIRIMRLVGAAELTIRMPLLLEALAHGGAGGALAGAVLWIASGTIASYLPGFVRQPSEVAPLYLLLLGFVAAGGLFGLMCGAFATRRLLRSEPAM